MVEVFARTGEAASVEGTVLQPYLPSGRNHQGSPVACTCYSVSIRLTPLMRSIVNMSASPSLRALFVTAVLVCLCVSSNVGLQLFPLPAVTSQAVLHVQQDQANKASHTHQVGAWSARVPIMAQSQKRADKEPPQSNPLIALPIDKFSPPGDPRFAIQIGYSVCFLASVTMTPHAGRAPPSLV